MKQISIIIALALLTTIATIANAQNIKGSHEVRANDEVKKQQVENRSENRPLTYPTINSQTLEGQLPFKYMEVTKDVTNVDSVFKTNFKRLYTIVETNKDTEIHNNHALEFIAVISMMSGIDFVKTHCYMPTKINFDDITNMHLWYVRNQKSISLDVLKRFYIATRVYCFESYDELETYFNQLDYYVIRDDEFKKWLSEKQKVDQGTVP